jgi:hypothetical protein
MNYKDPAVLAQIAIDDPGGAVETATATLKSMTVTEVFRSDENRVTERGLYDALGPTDAEAVLNAIASSAVVPDRAKAWVTPGNGGIDMGSAVARAMVDAMVTANELTAAQAQAVKALGERQVLKYPGIKAVHVEMARAL